MNAITQYTQLRQDRVRAHTRAEINRRIDEQTIHYLRLYAKADRSLIARRIDELDREWDVERTLEASASGLALTGMLLGSVGSRKWFILPLFVSGFLLLHAVEGWCPPVPLLRRLGVRTRKEIERERDALKLLRGDFDAFHSAEEVDVEKIFQMLAR